VLPKLQANPALATMPAFREHRVLVVKASLMSTLSQWNVAGAEQLFHALYPGELP
jgi:ABC-type Fe3+-hydroxamate transport system substrate-binding protein